VAIPPHPLPQGGVIDPAVIRGIRQASQKTQVDFGLLVAEAQQESGFQPDAKAAGSSATGLYQFVDSTWLTLVQRFGEKYGVGDLAQQITLDGSGRARVADPTIRQQILDLRRDPALSANLAAEYTKLNQGEVERALGRPASSTDLYMAHFLGSAGASQFLKAVRQDGSTLAASLLPQAAAANPAIFYDKRSGEPRTVSEIYRAFSQRIENGLQTVAALGGGGPAAASLAAGGSTGPVAPTAPAIGAAAPLPIFQRLVMGSTALTDPVRAMMDALAASALRMIRGGESASAPTAARATSPRRHDTAPT